MGFLNLTNYCIKYKSLNHTCLHGHFYLCNVPNYPVTIHGHGITFELFRVLFSLNTNSYTWAVFILLYTVGPHIPVKS